MNSNVHDFFKYKKLISKHEYVQSCLEEVEYKYNIYKDRFLKEYYEINEQGKNENTNENKEDLNENTNENKDDLNENKEDFDDLETEQTDSDKLLTKIFKKLSLKIHPDKGGNQEEFIELQDAYKKKQIVKIIKLCNKYGISITETDYSEYIEKEIDTLNNKINELTHHLCYLWCEEKDENIKKNFKLPT